jgi:hypothetical protein
MVYTLWRKNESEAWMGKPVLDPSDKYNKME